MEPQELMDIMFRKKLIRRH